MIYFWLCIFDEGRDMRLVTVFIVFVSLLLTGCAKKHISPEDERFEFVNEQAKKCVATLLQLAKDNNEPYTFNFAYYVTTVTVPVINASYSQSEKRAIPYFIVPTRDNNHAGSTWQVCMSRHRALDPNIQLPKYQD